MKEHPQTAPAVRSAAGRDIPGALSTEDAARALAALQRAATLRSHQLARRGGTPFPSSVELIRQTQEELSKRS